MAQLPLHKHHVHHVYQMKFNNINRFMDYGAVCDLTTQRCKKDLQASRKYWKKNQDDYYIAFCGPTHCTLVSTVSNTWRASDATSDRTFNLAIVPTAEHLGLNLIKSTRHFLSDRVNFFSLGVIPTDEHLRQFQAFKDDVTKEMVRLWETQGDVVGVVSSCSKIFNQYSKASNSDTLNVDREIQFNKWLFKRIDEDLKGYGFVTEDDQLNKSVIPDVCEYLQA